MNPDMLVELLAKQSIIISPKSLKICEHQGFMSTGYVANSNLGRILVQVTQPNDEHLETETWNKYNSISKILSARPWINGSMILYSGLHGQKFVTVQKFLVGVPAGKRLITGEEVIDNWDYMHVRHHLLQELGYIHQISFDHFGWRVTDCEVSSSKKFYTWKDFLSSESFRWLNRIETAEPQVSRQLRKFILEQVEGVSYDGPAVLVHGDAANPGNILVCRSKIALIDWEFCISADPAWEFCDIGWRPYRSIHGLKPYFDVRMIEPRERVDFLRRVESYEAIWLTWNTSMHARDQDLTLYKTFRLALLEKMRERST